MAGEDLYIGCYYKGKQIRNFTDLGAAYRDSQPEPSCWKAVREEPKAEPEPELACEPQTSNTGAYGGYGGAQFGGYAGVSGGFSMPYGGGFASQPMDPQYAAMYSGGSQHQASPYQAMYGGSQPGAYGAMYGSGQQAQQPQHPYATMHAGGQTAVSPYGAMYGGGQQMASPYGAMYGGGMPGGGPFGGMGGGYCGGYGGGHM